MARGIIARRYTISPNSTFKTPRERFEFLTLDETGRGITSIQPSIGRFSELLDRAEKARDAGEMKELTKVVSRLTEMTKELIDIKGDLERRTGQPVSPLLKPKDESELNKRTSIESLRSLAVTGLHPTRQALNRAQGALRNLRARVADVGDKEEVNRVKADTAKLEKLGKEIRKIQEYHRKRWPR